MYLLLKWIAFTFIVMFTAWLVPGIKLDGFLTAFVAAAVIAIVNISLKPMLNLITLPINILSLGLFTLVINAILLMFVAYIVTGFEIDGFIPALFGSIIMSILSIGLTFI